MKNKLIGICGLIGHGKDTAAGFLIEEGFERVSFAGVLKDAVANIDIIHPPAPMDTQDAGTFENFSSNEIDFFFENHGRRFNCTCLIRKLCRWQAR